MAGIDDLRSLYEVGLAFDGEDGVSVYSVSAEGFRSYVRGDDQATIDSLANPPAAVEAAPAVSAPAVESPIATLDPSTATPAEIVTALQQQFG